MRCNLGATVLMIGDHTDTVRLVRMALEFTAYELHVAPTWDEGVAMSVVCQPDLLIMEAGLFGSMGLKLIQSAQMLSGLPRILLRNKGVKLNSDVLDFASEQLILDKPFTPLRLHHAMDLALKPILE